MTDLQRARELVRELSEVLGATDSYWDKKGKQVVAYTDYKEIDDGQRTLQIDYAADGSELRRTMLPKAHRGMQSTDGAINDAAEETT